MRKLVMVSKYYRGRRVTWFVFLRPLPDGECRLWAETVQRLWPDLTTGATWSW